MPGIDIHIIPHLQTIGTVGSGVTTVIIATTITTANKPEWNILRSKPDRDSSVFFAATGNRQTVHIRFLIKKGGRSLNASMNSWRELSSLLEERKMQQKGNT
jgi:hypothetical protein